MFNRKDSNNGNPTYDVARPHPAVPVPTKPVLVRPDTAAHANSQNAADNGKKDASETKKLIVGRDISLHGKISACDRLIVEGQVEAQLSDCHTIEISEAGTFKGAAEIESAEISGCYEGNLTVRDRLLIQSTGRVSGTIRYGELEIKKGGKIKGDIGGLEFRPQPITRVESRNDANVLNIASQPA